VPSAATKNTAARHRVSFVRRRPRFSHPIPDAGGLTPGHPGSSFVDVRLSTHSAPTPPRRRASSRPVRSHRPLSRSRRQVARRGARRARSLWRCLSGGVARRPRAFRARRRSRSLVWVVRAPPSTQGEALQGNQEALARPGWCRPARGTTRCRRESGGCRRRARHLHQPDLSARAGSRAGQCARPALRTVAERAQSARNRSPSLAA
jgi:hypothetical protein